MIREIKNAPRSKTADRIYLPGEMELERQEAAMRDGPCLPQHVLVNLFGLAEDLGAVRELEAIFHS